MRIVEQLRARGGRMTVQRRLILDALARAKHHTTADEIRRRLAARSFEIDASTVYRNLEVLEELGHVTHTHLDGRLTRWHRADVERHGHLVCRVCAIEQEIPLSTFGQMARRIRADHGFDPDLAHSAIVGVCRQCRDVSSS